MARHIAPGNVPADQGFAARAQNKADTDRMGAVDLGSPEEVLAASNPAKVDYYHAKAQVMANDLGCSVMCHWYVIPGFEHTPPTLEAALIPANDHPNIPPPPPPPEGGARSRTY